MLSQCFLSCTILYLCLCFLWLCAVFFFSAKYKMFDSKRNTTILKELKTHPVLGNVNNYKHRLIQHVSRMDRPRLVQAVTKYQPAGYKRRKDAHQREFWNVLFGAERAMKPKYMKAESWWWWWWWWWAGRGGRGQQWWLWWWWYLLCTRVMRAYRSTKLNYLIVWQRWWWCCSRNRDNIDFLKDLKLRPLVHTIRVILTWKLLTYLLHGAESFLRS